MKREFATNRECKLPKWVPEIDSKEKIKSLNSWFKISTIKNKDPIKQEKQEIKFPLTKGLQMKKVRLYPNERQKKLLHQWLEVCTKMYNATVKFVNSKIYRKDK